MAEYRVTYRTPVAEGDAVVAADGIHAAQAEALTAIHILTGHAPDAITLTSVAEYPAGRVLWTAAAQEDTAHVGA